jgi:hypothetical protein
LIYTHSAVVECIGVPDNAQLIFICGIDGVFNFTKFMQLERHYDDAYFISDITGNTFLKSGWQKLTNMTNDSINYV